MSANDIKNGEPAKQAEEQLSAYIVKVSGRKGPRSRWMNKVVVVAYCMSEAIHHAKNSHFPAGVMGWPEDSVFEVESKISYRQSKQIL